MSNSRTAGGRVPRTFPAGGGLTYVNGPHAIYEKILVL